METGIDRDRRSGKPDRPHCTPCLQKSGAPSADALDKAVTWLKTNNRISQTYSEYKNLIDTTFTKTNSTTIK